MQSLPTKRGRAVRTSVGWVWSCYYCWDTKHLGLTGESDLDVGALLARIDADHMHLRRRNP